MRRILPLLCLAALLPAADHLATVRRAADALIDQGLDTYGKRQTAMWAAIMRIR